MKAAILTVLFLNIFGVIAVPSSNLATVTDGNSNRYIGLDKVRSPSLLCLIKYSIFHTTKP